MSLNNNCTIAITVCDMGWKDCYRHPICDKCGKQHHMDDKK